MYRTYAKHVAVTNQSYSGFSKKIVFFALLLPAVLQTHIEFLRLFLPDNNLQYTEYRMSDAYTVCAEVFGGFPC